MSINETYTWTETVARSLTVKEVYGKTLEELKWYLKKDQEFVAFRPVKELDKYLVEISFHKLLDGFGGTGGGIISGIGGCNNSSVPRLIIGTKKPLRRIVLEEVRQSFCVRSGEYYQVEDGSFFRAGKDFSIPFTPYTIFRKLEDNETCS